MSKIVFFLLLSFLLLSQALPVFADGYDDCLAGCGETVAPCVEQVRLTAGNIKEEEDRIAACEKSKEDCMQACKNAEASPQSQPPAQEQPQEQPQSQPQPQPQPQPQGIPGIDTSNDIKTYEFK